MPPKQRLKTDEDALDHWNDSLSRFRQQRLRSQAQKFRDSEETMRRKMVAEKIVRDGLQGEEAFRLMGNRSAPSNPTRASPTQAAVDQVVPTVSESVLVQNDGFPADDFLGMGPTAIVLIMSPERAEEMEKAVGRNPGTTVIQTWPLSGKQTLVVYSDLATDWDDICLVATLHVKDHSRVLSLVAKIFGSAIVLGLALLIGILAAYVVLEYVPLDIIRSLFRGDFLMFTLHVLRLMKRFRLRVAQSFHHQFQSGLALLVAFLESLRDLPIRGQPRTIGV